MNDSGMYEDWCDESEPLIGRLVMEAAKATNVFKRTERSRRVGSIVEATEL